MANGEGQGKREQRGRCCCISDLGEESPPMGDRRAFQRQILQAHNLVSVWKLGIGLVVIFPAGLVRDSQTSRHQTTSLD